MLEILKAMFVGKKVVVIDSRAYPGLERNILVCVNVLQISGKWNDFIIEGSDGYLCDFTPKIVSEKYAEGTLYTLKGETRRVEFVDEGEPAR